MVIGLQDRIDDVVLCAPARRVLGCSGRKEGFDDKREDVDGREELEDEGLVADEIPGRCIEANFASNAAILLLTPFGCCWDFKMESVVGLIGSGPTGLPRWPGRPW